MDWPITSDSNSLCLSVDEFRYESQWLSTWLISESLLSEGFNGIIYPIEANIQQ